ncbi:hypothetical protein Barb7_00714 [Bacteroidales bacterium Barb7]|nr:hypothetical protein Barb7_00714 [Bacteroidales bacterium Barb7]
MKVRAEVMLECQFVLLDVVAQLLLFFGTIAAAIYYNCFACVVMQEIGVFGEVIYGKQFNGCHRGIYTTFLVWK